VEKGTSRYVCSDRISGSANIQTMDHWGVLNSGFESVIMVSRWIIGGKQGSNSMGGWGEFGWPPVVDGGKSRA